MPAPFRQFLGMTKGIGTSARGITMMGIAGAGIDAYTTYYFDQLENPQHSKEYSMLKGAATGAAWLIAEPLMWGVTVGSIAKEGLVAAYKDAREQEKLKQDIEMHVTEDATGAMAGTLGGRFYDTQQTYTMRQRQMDLLRRHRISTESILGSEARQLHR